MAGQRNSNGMPSLIILGINVVDLLPTISTLPIALPFLLLSLHVFPFSSKSIL